MLFRRLGDRNGSRVVALWSCPEPHGDRPPGAAPAGCLEESLPIHRELGDELGVKRAVQLLGTIAYEGGDTVRGRELLGESVELSRSYGDRFGVTVSRHSLGELRADGFPAGRRHRPVPRGAQRRSGDRQWPAGVSSCAAGLSAVAAAQGEEERAAGSGATPSSSRRSSASRFALLYERATKRASARSNANPCLHQATPSSPRRRSTRSAGEPLVRVEQATCANPRGHVVRLGAIPAPYPPTRSPGTSSGRFRR